MNVRRTTLLIAIVLAVGTGWLTLTYLSSLKPAENQPRQVLITTQIPAREKITASMFTVQTRSSETLQPDAISNPNQAIGSLALITIPSGSQLTASQIGMNAPSALPVRLQPGMRAVSIPIDRVKGVSGLIQPGDRVDVIAIPPTRSSGPPDKAVTIFRGVRVLAVGSALENASATPSPDEQSAATVTLEVNPKQADLLAWADQNSTLRLALRSPRERLRSEPVEILTLAGNSGGGAPAPSLPEPIAPPALAMGPFPAPGPRAPPPPARSSSSSAIRSSIPAAVNERTRVSRLRRLKRRRRHDDALQRAGTGDARIQRRVRRCRSDGEPQHCHALRKRSRAGLGAGALRDRNHARRRRNRRGTRRPVRCGLHAR